MKLEILIIGMIAWTFSSASEISPQAFGLSILEKLKKEKVTRIGVIRHPFENRPNNMLFDPQDIPFIDLRGDAGAFLMDANVVPEKIIYRADSDFFLIAYNDKEPVYALFHNGNSQEGAFYVYFCKLHGNQIFIGGRVLLTDSSLNEKGEPNERSLLIHMENWSESLVRRFLMLEESK